MIKIVLIILGMFLVLVVSSYTIGDFVFTKKRKKRQMKFSEIVGR